MELSAALDKLNSLLPLKASQSSLEPKLRELHIAILTHFATAGQALSRDQVAQLLGGADVDAALARLANDDLIVLSEDRLRIAGAYPFTAEERMHAVLVNGHTIHAMCALDALAIAPMFDTATRIDSRCHVSNTPIEIRMQGEELLTAKPGVARVGIHWQGTHGCAAQSLCMEMVFLGDAEIAQRWQQQDSENTDLFELPDAVRFAAAYFRPLLQ
ncbi:MAG TPA: alkylmercury lyase family protein [Gammaproteobacteria bacterium]|nr:alkylmercury lyase family protein [Gammaproteobacteria bacterium]